MTNVSKLIYEGQLQCTDCPILLATVGYTKGDCPCCDLKSFTDMAWQLEFYKVRRINHAVRFCRRKKTD